MADNTVLNTGSGGDTIRTLDASSVKYPVGVTAFDTSGDPVIPQAEALADADNPGTTIILGAAGMMFNGTTWDRIRGDTTNGLDVDVTRSALPTGAATETTLDAIKTAVELIDNAVAGNELQVDVVSSALPADAATETTLAAIAGYLDTEITAIVAAVQLLDNIVSGNEAQVDVVTSALPTGAATAANQGTANTALSAIQTAVELIDNAIAGSEMQVDVVTSALPTGAATSALQTTGNSALSAIQTAVELIDNAISGSEMQVDVITLPGVAGDVAHDAADAGNPLKVGGKAAAEDPALVADGDRANLLLDRSGRVLTGKCPPEEILDGTANATDTSDTAVIAAQGAGFRIYVTRVIISNESTTSTAVLLKSAATTKLRVPAPTNSDGVGGCTLDFDPPLRLGDNEAFNFASAAAVTTMHVSAVGYKGR